MEYFLTTAGGRIFLMILHVLELAAVALARIRRGKRLSMEYCLTTAGGRIFLMILQVSARIYTLSTLDQVDLTSPKTSYPEFHVPLVVAMAMSKR